MIIPSRRRGLAAAAALAAAMCGITAAILLARAAFTIAQGDAHEPLVVARRLADSSLPLPSLLNAILEQLDILSGNGRSAVALSIASFAVAAGALAWIVSRVTDSLWACGAAVSVFVINPNLLYLQSTPTVLPLMLGLTLLSVALTIEWCSERGSSRLLRPSSIGAVFALACFTRYEVWAVALTALAGAVWARHRSGLPASNAFASVAPIAVYPALTILTLLVFSRIFVGDWFSGDFVVRDNPALGDPRTAANQILTGVRTVGGTLTTVIALVGLLGLAARGLVAGGGAAALVALSPAAAAVIPWFAFFEGHPYRVRYMVFLLAAQAIGIGAAASRWKNATPIAAVVLMVIAALELTPMFGAVPIAVEVE